VMLREARARRGRRRYDRRCNFDEE